MSDTELTEPMRLELMQLHAATSALMVRFINGHHCPKLAHLIVRHLAGLLTYPELAEIPANRAMYRQLMEHWQQVANQLLEQRAERQQHTRYH